ncbi:MAG: hypothetical protein IIZ93_06935 [Acidaminococcaceae bacterium]|nr:hypothetical protein [Acidaminococcaceae bacterium]
MTGLKKLLMWKAASGGGTAPQTETLSGNLVTFSTGKTRFLKHCTVAFSGAGRTGLTITHTGKNLFDKTTGIDLQSNNIRVARNEGKGVPFLLRSGITYTFSCNSASQVGRILLQVPFSGDTIDQSGINVYSYTYTPSADISVGINFFWSNGRPDDATDIQIEVGSEATAFEAYEGTKNTVTWPDTVTSGTFDAVSGMLSVTGGGTIQIDPVQISTFSGINNVWSDTGEITVTYTV